jgi:CubicO group peptidase (beta-lactamase class C family)
LFCNANPLFLENLGEMEGPIMKPFSLFRFVFLLFFCLALTGIDGCENETNWPTTIKQISALIEKRMQENNIIGLSIALVDGQDVVWSKGFGYADKENNIKATTETIYEIGSVTKTITGTAVMHAQDKGLLNIDHPLTEYLPQFSILPPLGFDPEPDNPITLRTMLTHHSGIPGNFLNGDLTLNFRGDYTAWLLDYLQTDYACFPPNFVHSYCNSAFCLLADVVAAASGQTWEEYTDSLFEAMGMEHTSYYLNKPFLKENRARGYFNGEPLEHFFNSHVGAGSVNSNVSDMANYIKMVLGRGRGAGNRILSTETIDEMLTPQDLGVPLDAATLVRWGLSWVLTDPVLEYAGRICAHTGATIGFCSHLEILLDQQLGVVISTNADQKNALNVVVEVGRETLKLALKDKTGINPVEPSKPAYSPYADWPQEKLEALAGIYVTEQGYDMVRAVPGGLEWIAGGGTQQKLVPLENGRLAPPDSQEFQIAFNRISGRDVMLMYEIAGKLSTSIIGDKCDPVQTPDVWRDRLGKYGITNLYPDDCSKVLPEELWMVPHSIDLSEKDGMLVIKYPVQGLVFWIVLEPLSDKVALIRGIGNEKGGAVQMVVVNGQEQLQVWGNLYSKR